MTLVDSNVVLDVVTRDPRWLSWSLAHLETAGAQGELVINDIVYAEISIGYERVEEVDDLVSAMALKYASIPQPALFLAGKVFKRYRAAGGIRSSVLPDLFIGAHAAVLGIPLLTRDPRRYRTYFPTVLLIAPEPSM